MSVEIVKETKFEVNVITPEVLDSMSPPAYELQELVYSRYTVDGERRPIVPPVSSPLSKLYEESTKNVVYIVATGDAERMFQTPLPENQHLKKIESDLREFKRLAGFLRVEWGVHKRDESLPIEAMVLTKGFPWPENSLVGYAASFTTNPLLPRSKRVEIQKDLHKALYALAEQEGYFHHIYTILAPHVVPFVEASGLTAMKVSDSHELNRGDAYADSVFDTFPGYWTKDPSIYRIVPTDL